MRIEEAVTWTILLFGDLEFMGHRLRAKGCSVVQNPGLLPELHPSGSHAINWLHHLDSKQQANFNHGMKCNKHDLYGIWGYALWNLGAFIWILVKIYFIFSA